MNFWKEVVVLLDWVSDKTKQKEGKIVFEQIEKHLPELIEKVDDKIFAKKPDICEDKIFDFNYNCVFSLAMKNAFGEIFKEGLDD